MKKEKLINIITIAVFLVMLYSLSIAFLIKPAESFSDEENRELAQFPSFTASEFFSGGFSSDINKYFADQFPLRNTFVGIKALTELALLKQENNGVILGENGQLTVRYSAIQMIDPVTKNIVVNNVDKFLPASLESEAQYIARLSDSLSEKDISFALLMPPRTIDVAASAFSYPSENSQALMSEISRIFGAGEYFIDIAPEMKERYDNGEYVYYKTDHHWTSLGAYYCYRAIMEHFGLEPYPLESFERETVSDAFYGTTHSKGGFKFVEPDTIEFFSLESIPAESFTTTIYDKGKNITGSFSGFYDLSYLDRKDKYSAFISGTNAYTTVIADSGEDRPKMLILKDSFTNSLVPFLALHFDLELVTLDDYSQVRAMIAERAGDADYVIVQYNVDNLLSAPKFESVSNLGKWLGND